MNILDDLSIKPDTEILFLLFSFSLFPHNEGFFFVGAYIWQLKEKSNPT